MIQKEDSHIFTGLQQDLAVSKQLPSHLIDAHNIRITANNGDTLFSLTNEKGPLLLNLVTSSGQAYTLLNTDTIIGYCTINDYLIIFITGTVDKILRIDMSQSSPVVVELFSGDLNFQEDYPIEAVPDYENSDIQKVYWTDGINQPRMINIMHTSYSWNGSFDFSPELTLKETVTITRDSTASGSFPAGVIQYAFTYYNKYGQETAIFYVSPLYNVSYADRGASPEDVVSTAFKINVTNIDTHFDYLRIYSIERTSLDGTPIVKRVQDIETSSTITFIDKGTSGETVDSTALLFKGSETVTSQNICSKDGTLFLGNLELSRPSISTIPGVKEESQELSVTTDIKQIKGVVASRGSDVYYYCMLNTPSAGFKNREYYRFGYQAQYKNGSWSEPVWINDTQIIADKSFGDVGGYGWTPIMNKIIAKCAITDTLKQKLKNKGYKRVRPLIVFPEMHDRTIISQGIVNPTVWRESDSNAGITCQSSWFLRPLIHGVSNASEYIANTDVCSKYSTVPYSALNNRYLPNYGTFLTSTDGDVGRGFRGVEVEGQYEEEDMFRLNWNTVTYFSPELEFDDTLKTFDYAGIKGRLVGKAVYGNTFSDSLIETSTPTVKDQSIGVIKHSSSNRSIVSQPLYDDWVLDDRDAAGTIDYWQKMKGAVKWLIYPWQCNGSLNNDIVRPNGTQRTAVLSKKIISNLRNTYSSFFDNSDVVEGLISTDEASKPQVFDSDEATILKQNTTFYMGNVDTLITSKNRVPRLFYCGEDGRNFLLEEYTSEYSINLYKIGCDNDGNNHGISKYLYPGELQSGEKIGWKLLNTDIGDHYDSVAGVKESVRMKYKTTPHMILSTSEYSKYSSLLNAEGIVSPIVELYRDYDASTAFGGQTEDAFKANKWLPAGEPVSLDNTSVELVYEYGDTWYNRYDHIVTYPFSSTDVNQVVEIGSFFIESHINLDGRYDRNRQQLSNLYMTPKNFNLMNSVYSQKNNYFEYQILDEDYYSLNKYSTQITWSTQKTSGMEVDPWTSLTLASTFDVDGTYGPINALVNWSNNLYCFQDTNICNILFNSRVQIPTSDGVPIEITNSYKVDGKRDYLNNVGCTNKYSICKSPTGLYFLDTYSHHLMAVGSGGLKDMALSFNMQNWFSKVDIEPWKPNQYTSKVFYDYKTKDLYTVVNDEALLFNENLSQFISFMSYDGTPYMFNTSDAFFCVKDNHIYKMNAGEYNNFFGEYKDYDITFVSNGMTNDASLTTIDKTYSTMDFRCDVFEGSIDGTLLDDFPFATARLWDEYQDTGVFALYNIKDHISPLKKKFRQWHLTIPRDSKNGRDRIRNNWCKVTLSSNTSSTETSNAMILHDTVVQYFV